MHELAFLKNELESIESFLSFHRLHSIQRTVRTIENVHIFHAAHLKERVIEGFIWMSRADEIQYEIDMSRAGAPSVNFILSTGNASTDIECLKAEILHLFKTAKVRKAAYGKPGGGGGRGKKGFYLEVGIAKKTALLNFGNAVKNGVGSSNFVNFCVPRNFTMTYFKGSNR